ncbi:MAG TPA: GAF domain-containing sensor histidine kinase [Longimicrobium sp.]|nr:GAF domain-containing sensor histidine kinase [Longimicrobium sp.]
MHTAAHDPLPGAGPAPAWRALLVFSLLALALAPFAFEWRTRNLQTRIQDDLEPLRALVGRIEMSESEQVGAIRGYQLYGEAVFLRRLQAATAREEAQYDSAVRMAAPLDPAVGQRLREMRRLGDVWRRPHRELLAGRAGPAELRRHFMRQEQLYRAVLTAGEHVDGEIRRIEQRLIDRMEREEVVAQVLGVILAIAGLAAAVAVVRLGQKQRALAEEARRLAREEAALRRATGAVSAGSTTDEVITAIAENAIRATDAESAFVERIDARRGEVAVVAAAGAHPPPLDARIPYDGSFAQQVIECGHPQAIDDLSRADRPVPGELAQLCAGCPALVVPLADGGEAIGALVLVRATRGHAFTADEVARAQAFADLATVALRRVHLMEEAQQRRAELERITEGRVRLLRGFSHDVKNPLGAADGHASLLEMGVLGELQPRQLESVGRIRASIRSALELIGDLLELARAEAGQIEVQRRPVDVRDVAREIVAEYHAQAAARGLELGVELPPEMPVVVTDVVRARQVLGNLISNAVKYTPKGTVTVRVDLRGHDGDGNGKGPPRRGRWVAVDVADTGPGIPREQHGEIFREFGRLTPSAARGFGLGLAISQRVAAALGGCITVDSEVGRGSTFTLWLPADEVASRETGA